MLHQNVLPTEQLYSPHTNTPPWRELSGVALSLIASQDVSPQLYSGGETPMSKLIDSGYDDLSYEQFIWESCRTLCVEALARQRTGQTMTRLQMTEGVPVAKAAEVAQIKPSTLTSLSRIAA